MFLWLLNNSTWGWCFPSTDKFTLSLTSNENENEYKINNKWSLSILYIEDLILMEMESLKILLRTRQEVESLFFRPFLLMPFTYTIKDKSVQKASKIIETIKGVKGLFVLTFIRFWLSSSRYVIRINNMLHPFYFGISFLWIFNFMKSTWLNVFVTISNFATAGGFYDACINFFEGWKCEN